MMNSLKFLLVALIVGLANAFTVAPPKALGAAGVVPRTASGVTTTTTQLEAGPMFVDFGVDFSGMEVGSILMGIAFMGVWDKVFLRGQN